MSHEKTRFVHSIKVSEADIDELDHVNNVVYIRWVQEVAEAHWLCVAPPEMRQRYRWVVLRHEIDYKMPVTFRDNLAGTTWVGMHHGPRFDRYVRLQSPDGSKVFAEAKTTWCLLDSRNGKPLRIPGDILDVL